MTELTMESVEEALDHMLSEMGDMSSYTEQDFLGLAATGLKMRLMLHNDHNLTPVFAAYALVQHVQPRAQEKRDGVERSVVA